MSASQPNTSSPEVYAQIWALSKTVLKPDGTPNFAAIGRQVGTSKDTVQRTLNKPEVKIEYPAFVRLAMKTNP